MIRSRLFYCDPSSPGQKGACENNHEFIRRIIPKSTDLGQYTQSQIDIMMDHINSYGRPELGDKSPYEMFEFYYGKEINATHSAQARKSRKRLFVLLNVLLKIVKKCFDFCFLFCIKMTFY